MEDSNILSPTTITDNITNMYDMAVMLLCTHEGVLTDWEIELLGRFVEFYWTGGTET